MIPEPKTPAASAKADGGDRVVHAGAEPLDHIPPRLGIASPSWLGQDAWLRQVSADPAQGNAAFRAAWAVSTLLRDDGEASTTLKSIGAVAGLRGQNGESAMWVRRGLLSLERGGHLWVDRSQAHGRGHFHRYALILKPAANLAA